MWLAFPRRYAPPTLQRERLLSELSDFVSELKRRRVFRALAGWGIVTFAALQVTEPVMHALDLPDWTLKVVVGVLALGFPVTILLSWTFDLRSTGIVKTAPASEDLSGKSKSLRRVRLAMLALGFGVVAAAPGVAWVAWRSMRATTTSPASPPSIAVLPFADMSPQKDQEYFADGVAEEILGALAHVEGLRVIGRTSSFSFRGKSDDVATIAQKLRVGALLEGSVRKEGSKIRITAQLINAADGSPLWSQTFDRELAGVLAVQDEIARAVVAALRVKLLPRDSLGSSEGQSGNPEARNQYLLGVQFARLGSRDGYRRAEAALRKAIALDPGYARAHALLAEALWGRYNSADAASAGETQELQRGALAAAERAVALAPGLAGSYQARGAVRRRALWDWPSSKADLERAQALSPNDPDTLWNLGWQTAMLGGVADGLALLQRATDVDPLSPEAWRWLAFVYLGAGEDDRARRALLRALEIAPEHDWALATLAMSLLSGGDAAGALRTMERSRTEMWRLWGRALAHHTLGHPGESQAALDSLVPMSAHVATYQIAEVYAWRGERDQAFEWLERCYREHDSGLLLMAFDPLLRDLHADPRWKALLEKMRLPMD